jgi:hypothetical protein
MLDSINWQAVADEIAHTDDTLLDVEFEIAKNAVWDTAEVFLPIDDANLHVESLERTIFYDPKDGYVPVKAVLDICGTYKDDAPLKPYSTLRGKRVVIDWKTTGRELDQSWRDRYKNSWQGRIYALAADADIIEYRGISYGTDKMGDPVTNHKTILMSESQSAKEETRMFLKGVRAMHSALVSAQLPVWPQRMPDACGAWRGCEYKDECVAGTMPKYVPEVKPLSYTRISNLLKCPEYYRRGVDPEAQEQLTTEALRIGSAVHRGVASVWSQHFGVALPEVEKKREEL